MPNKINPSSVHLGGDSPQFFAEYLPVDPQDLPASCALPPALQLNLTPVPLVPLNETCQFQFPDVFPIPPVYNEPIILPPFCENINVTTSITTCPATKNSFLALNSSGPSKGAGAGNECSINLEGNLCVDACETFSGNVHVNFANAAKNSLLNIVSRGTPDCGFDLIGNVDIVACQNITAAANISTCSATKNSYLTLIATGPKAGNGECRLDLQGNICAEACESFTASASVKITGPSTKGKTMVVRDSWQIKPTSIPNCGIVLTGDVDLLACVDFEVDGQFQFKGPHWTQSDLSVTAKGSPDCGLILSGGLALEACADFLASSTATIKGSRAGLVTGDWTITSAQQPNCGLDITGDILINACTQMDLEAGIGTGGVITISNSKGTLGEIDLAPTISIASGSDDCSKKITINLGGGNIFIPDTVPTDTGGGGGGGGGGDGGGVTVCDCVCYDCDPQSGCQTSLRLNILEVNLITQPSYPCCDARCFSFVDLCESRALLRTLQSDYIQATGCASGDGSANYLDLDNGSLYLAKDDWYITYGHSSITLGEGTEANCKTELFAGSLSISGNSDNLITLDGCNSTASFINSAGQTDIQGGVVSIYDSQCRESGGESLLKVDRVQPSVCAVSAADTYVDLNNAKIYLKNAGGDVPTAATATLDNAGIYFDMPGEGESQNCSISYSEFKISSPNFVSTRIGDNFVEIRNGGETYGSLFNYDSVTLKDSASNTMWLTTTQMNVADSAGKGVNISASGITLASADIVVPDINDPTGLTNDVRQGANVYVDSSGVYVSPSDKKGGVSITETGIKVESPDKTHNVNIVIPKDDHGNELSASWQEVTMCIDGVNKKAWVLMTTPQNI